MQIDTTQLEDKLRDKLDTAPDWQEMQKLFDEIGIIKEFEEIVIRHFPEKF